MTWISEDQVVSDCSYRTLQKTTQEIWLIDWCKTNQVHDIQHSLHAICLIYPGRRAIDYQGLGHKDIQMILNTYGHLYPSQLQKKVG